MSKIHLGKDHIKKSFIQMAEIYQTRSSIPKHLQRYCSKIVANEWFEHPFVRQMLPFEVVPDLETEIWALEERFHSFIGQEDWESAIEMIETDTYCAEYLEKYCVGKVGNDPSHSVTYWRLVWYCVREKASSFRQGQSLIRLLSSNRPLQQKVFCGEDYEKWKALSEPLDVWRGVVASTASEARIMIEEGIHWTINPDVAEKFSSTGVYSVGNSFVAKGKVWKEDILGFRPSEGEGEVLVLPRTIDNWSWM